MFLEKNRLTKKLHEKHSTFAKIRMHDTFWFYYYMFIKIIKRIGGIIIKCAICCVKNHANNFNKVYIFNGYKSYLCNYTNSKNEG